MSSVCLLFANIQFLIQQQCEKCPENVKYWHPEIWFSYWEVYFLECFAERHTVDENTALPTACRRKKQV
jgi:hypothetical protein